MKAIFDYLKRIKELKESKKEVINILEKISQKSAEVEDVEKLCGLLIYNSGYFKSQPEKVVINNSLDESVSGCYSLGDNSITFNNVYVEKILTGKENIMDLLDTIGHEMRHCEQDAEINNAPKEDKKYIEYYNSLQKDFDRNTVDLRSIAKIMGIVARKNDLAFFKKFNELSNQDKLKKFYNYKFANYYELAHEKDARDSGLIFAKNLVDNICNDKSCSKTLNEYLKNSRKEYYEKRRDNYQEEIDTMKDYFEFQDNVIDNLNIQTIDENEDNNSIHEEMVKLFLKDKTKEEINDIIEFQILNGRTAFLNVCFESKFYRNAIDKKRANKEICEKLKEKMSNKEYFSGLGRFVEKPTNDLIDTLIEQKRYIQLYKIRSAVGLKILNDKKLCNKIDSGLEKLSDQIIEKYNYNKENKENLYDGIYIEDLKTLIVDAKNNVLTCTKENPKYNKVLNICKQFGIVSFDQIKKVEEESYNVIESLNKEAFKHATEQDELCDKIYGKENRVDYKQKVENDEAIKQWRLKQKVKTKIEQGENEVETEMIN